MRDIASVSLAYDSRKAIVMQQSIIEKCLNKKKEEMKNDNERFSRILYENFWKNEDVNKSFFVNIQKLCSSLFLQLD
jgi:hypothetical protein